MPGGVSYGDAAPVQGKAAVGEAVRGFFASIAGLSHELADVWVQEDVLICHGTVTYTRHDGTRLQVPFANILGLEGGLVSSYRVFVDASALYA
jgi:ketosteroid isomerase-like protein